MEVIWDEKVERPRDEDMYYMDSQSMRWLAAKIFGDITLIRCKLFLENAVLFELIMGDDSKGVFWTEMVHFSLLLQGKVNWAKEGF